MADSMPILALVIFHFPLLILKIRPMPMVLGDNQHILGTHKLSVMVQFKSTVEEAERLKEAYPITANNNLYHHYKGATYFSVPF